MYVCMYGLLTRVRCKAEGRAQELQAALNTMLYMRCSSMAVKRWVLVHRWTHTVRKGRQSGLPPLRIAANWSVVSGVMSQWGVVWIPLVYMLYWRRALLNCIIDSDHTGDSALVSSISTLEGLCQPLCLLLKIMILRQDERNLKQQTEKQLLY